MHHFKNILFDLGGILMDIDYNRTEQAFINLGVTHFADLYTQHHANPLFEHLETGKIDEPTFYNELRKASGVAMTDEQIKTAWNAMLITFQPAKLLWLQEVAGRYPIYLFSNTNIIHYNCFQQIFKTANPGQNFDDYFIKAYYSHQLGFRKPYAQAFTQVLERENLVASETLFIDDTLKNIEGAKEAGLQTMLLVPPQSVVDVQL